MENIEKRDKRTRPWGKYHYNQPPPYPPPPPPPVQPPPPPPPYTHHKPKKSKTGLIIGTVIIIIFLVIFIPILVNYILPQAGINVTTGAIEVRYNSVWGNDIEIRIDGKSQGTHPSDEFVTFDGISPGTHRVEAYDLEDGGYLDGRTVDVNAGETATVELSYW